MNKWEVSRIVRSIAGMLLVFALAWWQGNLYGFGAALKTAVPLDVQANSHVSAEQAKTPEGWLSAIDLSRTSVNITNYNPSDSSAGKIYTLNITGNITLEPNSVAFGNGIYYLDRTIHWNNVAGKSLSGLGKNGTILKATRNVSAITVTNAINSSISGFTVLDANVGIELINGR